MYQRGFGKSSWSESISFINSFDNVTSRLFRLLSSCAALLAAISTDVMKGFCRTNANAIVDTSKP